MKAPHKEYQRLKYDLRKQEAILRGTCGSGRIDNDLRLDSAKKIVEIKDKISHMRKLSLRIKQKKNFIPSY